MTEKKLKFALNLAHKELRIIPLRPNSKLPLLKNWLNRGSKSADQISKWHDQYANCNFGVLTGNGLIVLDVDNKNGKFGSQVLEEFGGVPETFTVATPNGGFHHYYRTSENISSGNFGNGLEFKANGCQVVCPGSEIDGNEYIVINDAEISEFPYFLLDKLNVNSRSTNSFDSVNINSTLDDESYSRLVSQLKKINPDLNYHDWLNTLYASMNIYGHEQAVIDALDSWSKTGKKYDQEEFIKKIKSYKPNNDLKVGFPTVFTIMS